MAGKQAGQMSGRSGEWASKGTSPGTLEDALTRWADPADPCAASRRVMQSFATYQAFPAWTPVAGEVLLCQVEQAVESKSPGITSLLELLRECARSHHLQEEEEEEEGNQQQHPHYRPHPHRAAPVVKAYTLLCAFPTRVLMEEGAGDGGGEGRGGRGEGFDCCAFEKGITYLFNTLLEHCRKAVLAQARLVGACQLQVVVDEGGSISNSDDYSDDRKQKRQYTMDHRRTILKDLNELLISLSVGVRADIKRHCYSLFTQLPGLLKEVGDYDTQASIVELIYRLTTSAERSCNVTQWFPELECTIQCLFLTISEFEPHCRRFLNAYNASLGDRCKVFTIPCHVVYIGKLKLCKPKNASYPRFWIDFNLDTYSILILCQVEGKSQSNDRWECLSIEHKEVERVNLTQRMHSYTLEVEYNNLTTVEELFSSPLNSDNCALLSTLVFFEFSPQPLLEKLCILLYGNKLTVNKLEPKGWRRSADSSRTISTSSSSCALGRKYSSAVTDVDADPSDPSIPLQENGPPDHLTTSQPTQSTVTSLKKYKKCSSVSMVCDVDVEVTEHCGRKSSKSKKPSLPTKRSKASAVFTKFNPSDLTKVNKRDATGEALTSEKHDTLPSNKSKSTEKPRSRRSCRKKGMISSTKCITIASPRGPQSSFGCYLPLSFTSLQPGAAVPKTRVVSQSPASTKTTSLGRKDMDVPKAQVIHKAAAAAIANSINSEEEDKHTEMKNLSSDTTEIFMQTEVTTLSTKVAAGDPKEEKVQCEEKPESCSSPKTEKKKSQPVHPASKESEEQKEASTKLSIIFPSSEESYKIDQDTHATKNCANSDIGSVTVSSGIHSQPKVQPGKTVATTQKHSTPSPHTVSEDGAPYGNILHLVSDTQTKTVGEKESKQTKMDSPKDLKTIIEQEHVMDPIQHMPETLVSTETSTTGDKSNSTKPVQAKHTWKKPNRIKALETNPIHSKIAPILQEPRPPIQEVHDDELFSPDSSPLQQGEATTQPFSDYVAPRASFPPRPPHKDPPETLVSQCIKGVDGSVKHTAPPDIEVATWTRSAAFESSSGVSLFHTPPEESTVDAARNCGRYLFVQEMKDKRTMSPLINLSKDGSDACFQDIGSSELRNGAEGISRQQEEAVEPQDYVLTPHEQAFGSQREILGPQREILGPQEDNFVPQEEVLGPQEEVIGPQKGVLCPPEEIFGSEKEGTVPQEEELREQEEVLKQEKVSEPHEVSAWDTENKDENTNKAQDSSVTNILSNSTSASPRRSNTKVIEVHKLFVLNSNCEKVEKLKKAKKSSTEPSGQLYSDQEKENKKKAKGTSTIKQLYQEQHVLSPSKGTSARDNQRKRGSIYQGFTPNTSEEVHRKHKRYPVLQKPEETMSLATRPCRGKIGNKRKLFDPMTQAHMDMNPPPEEKTLCPQSNQDRQSESLQMDKKIRKLEHNTTPRISHTGQDDKAADDSGKLHSAGKQRWFSKGESSVKTSRSSKSERKSKRKLPPKRASGFLEDSFLNHGTHTVYSDFDSSPAGVVDSWFTERIENAKYSRVAYYNTSSRKCTVEKERDQKRKNRKLRMTSDSDMSSSYLSVSSGIDRFSKAETVLKPTEGKAFKGGTKAEDTTECTMECIDISDSPAKISPKRKSTCGERSSYYALLTRGTTTSEVSQTSSHDEWEPPSTGKKKRPLPKKGENLTVSKSKERKSRREGGKWFKGKSSQDSSGLYVNNSSTLTESGGVADNLKPRKSPVDTLRHTSRSSFENGNISFVLTASRGRTGGNKGSSPCLQPPSVELQISLVEPQLSSPMPRTSLESLVSSSDLQKLPSPLQVMSTEPQTSSLLPRMPSPMSQILTPEEDLSSQPVRESLQPFVDVNKSQEHSTPRHASPVISEKTPSPVLTQSFEVHPPPQQTLETTDISAILNPEVDAHPPPSGPLKSTLLDNLLEKSKVTSTGPRFSYVSEAESSFITNQEEEKKDSELTVIRNEHMPGQCESPSVVDSVITELRYDRDQVASFTTSTTVAELHHRSDTACSMDDEPSHLSAASGLATPVLTPHKALVNAKSPLQLNTRVTEGDVKGRKRHHTTMSSITTTTTLTTTTTATISTACIQPLSTTTTTTFSSSSSPLSLVQSVAPTAMVPPQSVAGTPSRGGSSSNANFISRVYRQFMPGLQQTPPSSRRGGSPVHPQARSLFKAARRENEAHTERRQFSSLNPEVLAGIMAVIADLQCVSTAAHRLSRSIGTLLTKYMEHHGEEGEAV